ncbi:MAG: hypothetical protein NTU97_00550 [Candidatus Magasanikbacteria bacterium]|nr:hypothetical protein [Candidatus Magasanikbacteria bacterium]
MTIRVYLKGEVENHKDFSKHFNSEKGRVWPVYSFDHGGLTKEGDFFVLTINTLGGKVPEALLPYVEMITLRTEFDCGAMRELGIYEQDNCEAELTKESRSGVFVYVVDVTGKTVRDVINCYRTIRAGFLRPVKNKSYAATQIPAVLPEPIIQIKEVAVEVKVPTPVEPQDWFDMWMTVTVFLMNRPLMKKIITGWRKFCAWHVTNSNLQTCSWLGFLVVLVEVAVLLAALSWVSLLLSRDVDQKVFLRDHPNFSWMLFK